MRFWSVLLLLALTPFAIASSLLAQSAGSSAQQDALRAAQEKALRAERRSELLRQEASNAASTADRLVAQRAVLSAEIDAAEAQIAAATARIAIISRQQELQRAQLGVESEPVLRLNAALQHMTGRPTVLMMQPGQREDYVHVRAVMATVQPQIIRRTSALRQHIAVQSELRAQELRALKSLGDARSQLKSRQTALARLQSAAGGKAGALSADAAIAFEQAIAQGERARDIVGRMDIQRLSAEKASELAALDGPMLRPGRATKAAAAGTAYILPARGKLLSGFNELNATGYRERGVRIALANDLRVVAPAAGTVSFAGRYRSYGRIVIIEHGNGWNSLITHLGSTQVKKGQAVKQGAVLGSATSDAPEIGVELRKNGRVMDIATILG
ncbi:septal ring factor EnvC (AmiA/AmiB activator) [Sphingorhabdus rigui]|uniref:Septal ring factor EnvC (AmiA/AmiB activator) n=1 Tax=Sphingorhabdus rigui TaxID=1282858 RepID=A0A840AWR7_9SPHN|nr:M23 family metallopeptidase [Sphingorhabdus rigui]MBB3942051.1 septal ring factor EnvC (AmiA/AmiB activator) [Sphingorhabdus rigui]